MKRLFDLLLSIPVLLMLLPLFVLISILVLLDDFGPVFYLQERVGLHKCLFRIMKFRTMVQNADQKGLLTVGGRDPRVTRVGYYLRKYKLDELPQLINVIIGDMSLVGPRPEVMKYVQLYSEEQLKVLNVRPGITDFASIAYSNENELLSKCTDPEAMYRNEIMPAKLKLNLEYVAKQSLTTDLKILFATVRKILF